MGLLNERGAGAEGVFELAWDYNPAVEPGDFEAFGVKHGVRLLLQFGSTVSGLTHPKSDVDLAVVMKRVPLSPGAFGGLVADIQPCFPGREVDVAVVNHADPLFLKQVVEGCRILYGSPRALAELQIYAFKRYQDHRRFLSMEREYVRRQVMAPR